MGRPNENIDKEEIRFDVIATLWSMLEGDDMDFDGVDEDAEIWTKINYSSEADIAPEDFVMGLSDKEFERIEKILKEEGYL